MRLALLSGRDAATKISALAVAIVFICLIVLQGYFFWRDAASADQPPATLVKPAALARQNTPDIGQLAARHLFGAAEDSAPQYSEAKEDRSLNLTLRGIVANQDGDSSLAIIQSGSQDEETFALGDNVFNKGKLDFVAVDHVILSRSNGQLARLQLPVEESTGLISEDYLPQSQPDYGMAESPEPVINIEPEVLPEPAPEAEQRMAAEPAPEMPLEVAPEIANEVTPEPAGEATPPPE